MLLYILRVSVQDLFAFTVTAFLPLHEDMGGFKQSMALLATLHKPQVIRARTLS